MLTIKIMNSLALYLFIFSYVFIELIKVQNGSYYAIAASTIITAFAFGFKGSREVFRRQGKIFTFGSSGALIFLFCMTN